MACTTTTATGDAGSWNRKARFAGAAETAPGYWSKVDTEVLASGGKAGTEAELAGDKRRSSPRLGDRAALEDAEDVSGGSNNGQSEGEQPRRIRRKATANRGKLQAHPLEAQDEDIDQDVFLLNKKNENLRLQIALKTKELDLEENRRLQLELILKTKENESLLRQNEELKAENEQLKKTLSFLCGSRQSHQELEGFASRARVMNSMTHATALRSHKLLGPLKKKRSLTIIRQGGCSSLSFASG